MTLFGVFLALLFVYSLASRRIERTVVTAPIVFTAAGMGIALAAPDMLGVDGARGAFLPLAELGLVLLLFTDASRTGLRVLRSIRALPVRLLGVGMLLTLALGTIVATLVFPGLSVWEAGILAAILAPTDAGLGQIIVSSPSVPLRIRQALNVEAGLNDGLSVPFLLFFIALAASGGVEREASLLRFVGEQLGIGVAIGLGVGGVAGSLLGAARRRAWIADSFLRIGVVAIPLLCLVASEETGASMFIAAFVAGLAVQLGFSDAGKHSVEFAEEWGQLVNLGVFFLFGLLVGQSAADLDRAALAYAALSLTVVRMLPVAIALIGSRLSAASVLFMGWFGPRGLASIVLGLVYLEQEQHLPGEPTIRLAVMATVGISIFAHGLSALPGIQLYARNIASLGPASPERAEIG